MTKEVFMPPVFPVSKRHGVKETEVESEKFIMRFFGENYFDLTKPLKNYRKETKEDYYAKMYKCIKLRKELLAETLPHLKLIKSCNYISAMFSIFETKALEDELVREIIQYLNTIIGCRSFSLKFREGIRNFLKFLFEKKMIASLDGHPRYRPFDEKILSNFDNKLLLINKGIKKKYNNPAAKRLDLKNLFPSLSKGTIEKIVRSELSNREIAYEILSGEYNVEPSVVRDWRSEAKRNKKLLEALEEQFKKRRMEAISRRRLKKQHN